MSFTRTLVAASQSKVAEGKARLAFFITFLCLPSFSLPPSLPPSFFLLQLMAYFLRSGMLHSGVWRRVFAETTFVSFDTKVKTELGGGENGCLQKSVFRSTSSSKKYFRLWQTEVEKGIM